MIRPSSAATSLPTRETGPTGWSKETSGTAPCSSGFSNRSLSMPSCTWRRGRASGRRSRRRSFTKRSTSSARCACSRRRSRGGNPDSSSLPPPPSMASTPGCRSPKKIPSPFPSPPTPRRNGPPSCTSSRFITSLEEGRPIPFYGDGGSRRDYTYIEDIVDGVEAALSAPLSFEFINLGGAHPVTLADLMRALESATGKTAILDRQPDQPGDVPATYAAVEKAQRLLGFRARVPLEEGLRRSVEWYRSQK